MSNTMTAHEPIHYLDNILKEEEEKRCEYSHQWRNFTISRSGRFKSKNNKKRDVVDGKLFDADSTKSASMTATAAAAAAAVAPSSKEATINNSRMAGKQEWHSPFIQHSSASKSKHHSGKPDGYKSFYETNL